MFSDWLINNSIKIKFSPQFLKESDMGKIKIIFEKHTISIRKY